MDRYSQPEVLRILGVKPRQLGYWEHLGLVRPARQRRRKLYTFADLISLRTVKQLTESRVPARRLQRAIAALREQLSDVRVPLTELRILSNGRNVAVEYRGARLEPLSGQFLLNFETRALAEKIRVLPQRTAEDWFARALDCEADPAGRAQAIEAYRRVIELEPRWVDAHINLGTLLYEQGALERARQCFVRALELAPESALAHFNLASVLDDFQRFAEARVHLREAVRLQPRFADAHFNLARACAELGDYAEARHHWRCYLELEPHGPWAECAREQLKHRPGPPRPAK